MEMYGNPEIFNTDQGSQCSPSRSSGGGGDFLGGARWMGGGVCNVFIERLWRSLKYEAVYLHELADGFVAQRVIDEWIEFYNDVRPHSALGGRTPSEAYRGVAAPGREVA